MDSLKKLSPLHVLEAMPRVSGSRIGALVAMERGPIVDFTGNPFGPQPARVVASLTAHTLSAALDAHLPVLLIFENEDPTCPVIVDVVISHASSSHSRDTLPERTAPAQVGAERHEQPAGAARLARILGVEDDVVLVDDGAEMTTPVRARTAVALRNLKDPVVLLSFANGLSVIVGQLYPSVRVEPAGGEGADVLLKGTRVRIEADVELVLKSGACVVQLDARGKAVTSADQIVSRARGANKVQGGSVQLN
jgi:hypothetical protein